MRPFVINGDVWRVARVPAGDPSLIDRTDTPRLAVTDSMDRTIYVRDDLMPPLLDKVMLHEVAHAITVSWGASATCAQRHAERRYNRRRGMGGTIGRESRHGGRAGHEKGAGASRMRQGAMQ